MYSTVFQGVQNLVRIDAAVLNLDNVAVPQGFASLLNGYMKICFGASELRGSKKSLYYYASCETITAVYPVPRDLP